LAVKKLSPQRSQWKWHINLYPEIRIFESVALHTRNSKDKMGCHVGALGE
jgi:hypothetical protein